MQFSAIKSSFLAYSDTIIELFNTVFISNPDWFIHRILVILMVLILSSLFRIRKLQKQLNEADKRNTITLLAIQHYCAAINRSVNEVIESNKSLTEGNATILKNMRLTHLRVKDAYTGIFKHLDIKRIRRAPKTSTQEQRDKCERDREEHNAIIRETIDEMLKTELPR